MSREGNSQTGHNNLSFGLWIMIMRQTATHNIQEKSKDLRDLPEEMPGLFPLSLTFISGCWIFDFNLRHCLEDQLLTVPQEHTVIDSPLTMHSQGKGRRAHGYWKRRRCR